MEKDSPQLDHMVTRTYESLRRLARSIRREPLARGHNATSLIHEAYLRLSKNRTLSLDDDHHFVRVAVRAMRQFLVDRARAACALKRGGGRSRVMLSDEMLVTGEPDEAVVCLDDALTKLAALDLRKAHVVELRFFGGCDMKAIASSLDISQATVAREWDIAKAWLLRELTREEQ